MPLRVNPRRSAAGGGGWQVQFAAKLAINRLPSSTRGPHAASDWRTISRGVAWLHRRPVNNHYSQVRARYSNGYWIRG